MPRAQHLKKVFVALLIAAILISVVCYLTGCRVVLDQRSTKDTNTKYLLNKWSQHQAPSIEKNILLPSVCKHLACKQVYLKHLQQFNDKSGDVSYPIPPVRHLLWRSENVSAYFASQLRTWQKVHPDWTVLLWRDADLKAFVRKYFPGAWHRFEELASDPIMQVDMSRYMLLFKYGGVYADLDYSLVSSLDGHRRFHAVVTREPEIHALQNYGFHWPATVMANPAFLMSAPGHSFYRHCVEQLQSRPFTKGQPLSFGGPYGLTRLLEDYERAFPVANSALETVYVPPSYSFYSYELNRLNTSTSAYLQNRIDSMRNACKDARPSTAATLRRYCRDINNLDPITDKTQPLVAVHDMKKSGAVYDGVGTRFYFGSPQPVQKIFGSNLHFGRDWL